MNFQEVKRFLKEYDGPQINIMEVCGSHTAAISKNGIRGMLSQKIKLLSGPGCPVCVTPTAYADRLVELAMTPDTCVVTFGDMLRIPGSKTSLNEAAGLGARAVMVYSPMDIIKMAEQNPETTYVFAAVGFETTTPVYALLMEEIIEKGLTNVKLLTALKAMPGVIDYLCREGAQIDGFLAPGHVAAVTGSEVFKPLAEKYQIPFAVSGFEGEEILYALYGIVSDVIRIRTQTGEPGEHKCGAQVMNFYPKVVTAEGNRKAQMLTEKYFMTADAVWRGMGMISGTGRVLRPEYAVYDAGSRELQEDNKKNKACCCDKILMGKMTPQECPLFGKVCKPLTPQGACMVSEEGSCHSAYHTQA